MAHTVGKLVDHQSPAFPNLGQNRADRLAASLRAVVNAVPFVGAALAEIVTEIVPGQRLDRIEGYLVLLAEEIRRQFQSNPASEGDIGDWVRRPENVDLIEDGAHLAARALSDQRMSYIVHCVASGIRDEDRAKIHHKRVLSIVGQLDDEEILILEAFAVRDPEKFAKLRPQAAAVGSSKEVIEKNALYEAAEAKLERLSLIRFHQRMKELEIGGVIGKPTEKFSVGETDLAGQPRGYRDITTLGRLVLKTIGLVAKV